MKKLLIALGVSSALMLSPALAQTSTDTTAPAGAMEKKPMTSKPKKPRHSAKAKKPMAPKAPAAEQPKT